MDKDVTPEPELTLKQLDEKFIKLLQEFRMVYQKDIFTLNKILSTFEDKLSMIENQLFDISYKQKQIIDNVNKKEE